MKVFLEDDTSQRHSLSDVSLRDGFLPQVGGDNGGGQLSLPPMEPAIWCKVLILDSLVINCGDKTMTWTTTEEEGDVNHHVYDFKEECSAYDDEEELFELVKDIINKSFEDSNISILRMLHCYLLPRISFDTKDIKKVELVRRQQAQNIQRLIDKLEVKCFDVTDGQEKLDSIQEHFLPDINKMMDNGHCSKQFLELLLCDLVEHERQVREKIAMAESRYVQLVPTQPSALKRSSLELLEARQERDFLDKKLVLILTAREVIIDNKERLPSETETQPSIILESYMEKRCLLQTLKEEKNKLTKQQYCALMVREVLDTILADLHTHGFTQGDSADDQGSRPTDVLQGVFQPEWQTLGERVATIVYSSKHPIGKSFEKFCHEIHEICQDPYKQNGKNSFLKYSKSTFYVSLKPTEILSDGDYVSVEMDTVIEPYKDKLFQIKEKIYLHMKKIAHQLSEHFNNKESHFKDKLRLAYEACFYEKEHKGISWLYDKVYSQNVEDIKEDIQRIKYFFTANLLSSPVGTVFKMLFKESASQVGGFLSSFETSTPNCSGFSNYHTSMVDTEGSTLTPNGCLSLSEASGLSSSCYDSYDGTVCTTTATSDFLSSCENVLDPTFQTSTDVDSSEDMTSCEDIGTETLCGKYAQGHCNRYRSIAKARQYFVTAVKDCCHATSLKPNNIGSLGSLIDEWDTKAKPITESIVRSFSIKNKGPLPHSHRQTKTIDNKGSLSVDDEQLLSDERSLSIDNERSLSVDDEQSLSNAKPLIIDNERSSPVNDKRLPSNEITFSIDNYDGSQSNDNGKPITFEEELLFTDKAESLTNDRDKLSTVNNEKSPTIQDKKSFCISTKPSVPSNNENSNQCESLSPSRQESDFTFEDVFGPALNHIKAVFNVASPLEKLKHLTLSLDIILSKTSQQMKHLYSYRNSKCGGLSLDKCMPLLVLLILQLKPSEIAALCTQLVMIEDLMAPCLYEGQHGQTMDVYQKAFRRLEDLWLEISHGQIQFTVNGIPMSKDIYH